MSQASALSITFCFCFCFCGSTPCHVAQAASETSLCLRPAEIWGEDDVSLKRRCITGSTSCCSCDRKRVAAAVRSACVHDMTRCQLDAERLVLAAGCSSCHATSVLLCAVRALFYTCRLFQQCKQKRAPTPCSPISLSLAASVFHCCLWRLLDMFAAASWSVHPEAIVNAMRHALLIRVHH